MATTRKEHDKSKVPHDPKKMPENFAEMGGETNQGVFDDPTLRQDEQSKVKGQVRDKK